MEQTEKLGQEDIYELITGKEIGWQSIIYDLINSEQLDPWDIDLAYLANKYLEKIRELEEANFLVSSKVLLAATILLRLKSEILLYKHLKSIDEILFGKKPEIAKTKERIELDKNELPLLYPKTPLPRYKKVSIEELMKALNTAINTEMRRIRKEVAIKGFQREAEIVLPKTRINIKDRIRKIYSKILTKFKLKQTRISYSELIGDNKEEKVACFLPVLHLDSQNKLFLEQESHFDEIWIWIYHHYFKNINQTTQLKNETSQETGFENPLANFFNYSVFEKFDK